MLWSSRGCLGRTWKLLECSSGLSWAMLAPSWRHLGRNWGLLGHPGAIRGELGGCLRVTWGYLGPCWGHLGAILGTIGGYLGVFWGLSVKASKHTYVVESFAGAHTSFLLIITMVFEWLPRASAHRT